MAQRFATIGELNLLKKRVEKLLSERKVQAASRIIMPEIDISDLHPDEVLAVRNTRDNDYTDSGYVRWGTFIYRDVPKMDFDIRIKAVITACWKVDASCHTYFRLRVGASGYDQSGTVRWNTRFDRPSTYDYNPVVGVAFFDILASATGNSRRICCDVKVTNSGATITVIGDTNLEGSGTGGCEIRITGEGRV